jgi:hypothetical protein
VRHCGHRCCAITANAYHVHADPPLSCTRCAAVPPGADPAADEAAEVMSLAQLVADVVAQVAPQIPDLPTGAALAELVGAVALHVHRNADEDDGLHGLDPDERSLVLAGRVGLALAFPAAFDPAAR